MTRARSRARGRLRLASRVMAMLGLMLMVLAPFARAADPGTVIMLPTTGIVDQVMAGYLREGISAAAAGGAPAVVVKLDTPGGSLDATRDIVQTLLEAPLPVIVWVAPAGARAASAGTFITLAASLAAMAPGTNIGAASPVGAQGEDIEGTLGDKVMNDAIASITAIANERGRPVDWAVGTVRDATSYTVDAALAAGAIDIKAADLDDLLRQADGRTVSVAGQPWVLQTAGAPTSEQEMNPFQAFLHLLADPNIAFILFTLGSMGLLFELQNPNFVTGIVGAFAIILAFIGFGSLPLNIAGLLLIVLATVLFVLELTVTSHGLLAIAGLIAFVLGASALYTQSGPPTAPSVEVAVPIIVLMTTLAAAFLGVVLLAVVRSRRMPPVNVGVRSEQVPRDLVGMASEVRRALMPTGTVYAAGEEWTARSADGRSLERGTPVRIVGRDGLVLIVDPLQRQAGGRFV
ncbi:MAG: nodulation protein NfeD [Chloroflexi bacterium]|nr:nodulation protein NfeD [Chloroflexota bacterium]